MTISNESINLPDWMPSTKISKKKFKLKRYFHVVSCPYTFRVKLYNRYYFRMIFKIWKMLVMNWCCATMTNKLCTKKEKYFFINQFLMLKWVTFPWTFWFFSLTLIMCFLILEFIGRLQDRAARYDAKYWKRRNQFEGTNWRT